MGLDLVVEGAAKAGHEAEWLDHVERLFTGVELSDAETTRFGEISNSGYENIEAPRVGRDKDANSWIIAARQAQTPEEIQQTLIEFDGHQVLQLVTSDGIPQYSNGGLYAGVDATSFRGDFLRGCSAVIDRPLLEAAWEHKLPEKAVEYGKALLAAADAADLMPRDQPRGLLSRLGLVRPKAALPLAEQLDIVRSAGRWFVFWGQRGHPIRAYF